MKLPAGEADVPRPRLDTLNAYLQRGEYELPDIHTSYDTISKHLATNNPASLIAVDGPSNGGKTSLARALVNFYEVRGVPVSFIPLDYFLADRAARKGINQAITEGRLSIADYSAAGWEQDRYRETVLRAKDIATHAVEAQTIAIPHAYSRQTGTKEDTQNVTIQPGSIVVTEGVGIQTYHGDFFDTKIRVDTRNESTLLSRVLEREQQKPEGVSRLDDQFLRMRYETIDVPHTAYLRTNTPVADFLVDTSDFDEILLYKHR